MKKLIAVLLLVSGAVSAQIPVTDIAKIEQDVIKYIEEFQRWTEQAEQLDKQYEKLFETYEAATGVRNLGDIFSDPALRHYLPDDWRRLHREYRRDGYQGLAFEAAEIYREHEVFDRCGHIENRRIKRVCEAQAVKGAVDKSEAVAAYEATVEREEQIAMLQEQINQTEDPKAIAELQARIQIEQAAIANLETQMRMHQRVSQADDRLIEQERRELQAELWSVRGGIKAEPMTFGEN